MANHDKRNRRRIKKLKKAKSIETEPLSDTWYTMRKTCKLLDISITTFGRWSETGILKVSKRGAKLYVNEYHYQKCLRDGLSWKT